MTIVRRALGLSLAERYVMIAIGLLSSMIIARLLMPKEIGIYSVSLAVIGIAQVLRDFGIGVQQHFRLATGALIVMDDANRADETEIVKRWMDQFPHLHYTHGYCKKGCALVECNPS